MQEGYSLVVMRGRDRGAGGQQSDTIEPYQLLDILHCVRAGQGKEALLTTLSSPPSPLTSPHHQYLPSLVRSIP